MGCAKALLNSQKDIKKETHIRVNSSKTTLSEVEKHLESERVRFKRNPIPSSLKIEKSYFSISSSLPALTGEIYIQDFPSQLPAYAVDFSEFKNKEKVEILDMASSPGSKLTQIADILTARNFNYKITALEPEEKRLTKLINNVQKQNLKNIEIYQNKGEEFLTTKKFDIIFLDAPCSGNLISEKNWLKKRQPSDFKSKARLQRKLIKNSYYLLKKGGILVYSTCSLEPEENEFNIDWAIREYKFKPKESKLKLPFSTKPLTKVKSKELRTNHCIRIMPFVSGTEGFFISLLKK